MIGGAGSYTKELALGLEKSGHSIHILAGYTKNRSKDKAVDKNFEGSLIRMTRKNWRNKSRFWFLIWHKVFLNFLNNFEFDLVIFCNMTANIIGSKVFSDINIPYMVVLHGDDVDYFFAQPRIKDHIMFRKKNMVGYFQSARKIISVSKYLDNILGGYMPDLQNRSVVHHGIDLNNWPDSTSIRNENGSIHKIVNNGLDKEKFVLMTAGRIIQEKRYDNVLAVLSKLNEQDIVCELIVAGAGPYLPKLKSLAIKLDIQKQVHFIGSVDRDDMFNLYSICDTFILLSERRGETFGIVFLEAMLAGKPVIGTNIGGIPEVIDHEQNGFIVEPGDLHTTVGYLNRLIGNPELRMEMGAQSKFLMESKFNNVHMAKATLEGF